MVIVDDRDGSRQLVACPALRGKATLGRLEFADAALSGHGPNGSSILVGVEVKTVMDLLSSIASGRLAGHQLPGMFREYDHSWLAVHGQARPDERNLLQIKRKVGWRHYRIGGREVPWSYLEGWLLTATMTSPLKVKWLGNLNEVAAWVACLDGWLEKDWEKHGALKAFHQRTGPVMPPGANPVEVQIAETVASLPGMGWERAWAAAKKFTSIQAMVGASEADWKTIPGVGPVIARSLTETIRRRK